MALQPNLIAFRERRCRGAVSPSRSGFSMISANARRVCPLRESRCPPAICTCGRDFFRVTLQWTARAMAKHAKAPRFLTHEQIWAALDRLAERAGLSASGLARRAGLDPTTFNRSKRVTADGRERWPSTESLAKALAATNSSIEVLVHLLGDGAKSPQSVPLITLALAAGDGHFDDSGMPTGKAWGEIALPSAGHCIMLSNSGT